MKELIAFIVVNDKDERVAFFKIGPQGVNRCQIALVLLWIDAQMAPFLDGLLHNRTRLEGPQIGDFEFDRALPWLIRSGRRAEFRVKYIKEKYAQTSFSNGLEGDLCPISDWIEGIGARALTENDKIRNER